jgi:hypothetical protein
MVKREAAIPAQEVQEAAMEAERCIVEITFPMVDVDSMREPMDLPDKMANLAAPPPRRAPLVWAEEVVP